MFEAKTVMTKGVIAATPDTSITDAIRMLVKHSVSGLPVVDAENNLVGILTEKDALSLLTHPDEHKPNVADYMTHDVIQFDENESLINICNCLIEQPFRRVPITSGGKKLVGIISRRDIMKKILEMKHIAVEDSGLAGEDA